jgi:hypothetical protein
VTRPRSEIQVLKVWAQKAIDRCRMRDIQAHFRRAELLAALVEHYFIVRQRRFWGPKSGFAWLEAHDPETFRAVRRALSRPAQLELLQVAASRVYRVDLR